MRTVTKLGGAAAAALMAGAVTASAAVIDFTDNATGLSGGVSNPWTVTGDPVAPNTNEGGLGPTPITLAGGVAGSLVGDNDGLGIRDDEITTTVDEFQSVTITFDNAVRLVGAYFLDLFVSPGQNSNEQAYVSVDGGGPAAMLEASLTFPDGGGLGELTGLSLIGTSFTFFSGRTNDEIGDADIALAAIEVAAVPLPAGALLMGTAIGAFGVARRRKAKTVKA